MYSFYDNPRHLSFFQHVTWSGQEEPHIVLLLNESNTEINTEVQLLLFFGMEIVSFGLVNRELP